SWPFATKIASASTCIRRKAKNSLISRHRSVPRMSDSAAAAMQPTSTLPPEAACTVFRPPSPAISYLPLNELLTHAETCDRGHSPDKNPLAHLRPTAGRHHIDVHRSFQ